MPRGICDFDPGSPGRPSSTQARNILEGEYSTVRRPSGGFVLTIVNRNCFPIFTGHRRNPVYSYYSQETWWSNRGRKKMYTVEITVECKRTGLAVHTLYHQRGPWSEEQARECVNSLTGDDVVVSVQNIPDPRPERIKTTPEGTY